MQKLCIKIAFVLMFVLPAFANAQDWTALGGGSDHISIAVDGPNNIYTPLWKTTIDAQLSQYAQLQGVSGPVAYNDKVFIYTKYRTVDGNEPNARLMAYNGTTGQLLWQKTLDKAVMNSWSSPAVDSKHNTVLIGSGMKVYSFDMSSGSQRWVATLGRSIVNASVCVAGDISHARAFITDFTTSNSGKLYCINLDTNEPGNMYNPGQIVWSDVLGATSGNTPAYKDSVVYVGSVHSSTNWTGTIYAYDATATVPTRKWSATDPALYNFYGGITVSKSGFLYAATYNFYQGENNSQLVKIDCRTGTIIWKTATERTDSIPVVVGDKIYISGGVSGPYGSRPKLSAYRDNDANATLLWETPVSMALGGWTCQPVYANGKLYIGQGPGTLTDGVTDFYILDMSRTPADAGFMIAHFQGGGNNPAVMHDSIYTAGYDVYGADEDVLLKFYQPALLGDINKDRIVNRQDLALMVGDWLFDGAVGVKRADLNLDGVINGFDFAMLAKDWYMMVE